MEATFEQSQRGLSPRPDGAKTAAPSRICLMTLGGESFAIDLRHVREVFEPESITPIPGMPASLVGVANLRGTVIPIADLRSSLGILAAGPLKYAVVVRHGEQQIGILIDGVPEIRTIHSDDILEESNLGAIDSRPILSCLVKVENRVSGMVEVSRLLASVEASEDKY